MFRPLASLVLTGCLAACGPAISNTATAPLQSQASSVVTSAAIFSSVATLPAEARAELFAHVGRLTFKQAFSVLAEQLTDSSITIDGKAYTHMRAKLAASHAAIEAMDARFGTVAGLWTFLGINPNEVSIGQYQDGLAAKRPAAVLGLMGCVVSTGCDMQYGALYNDHCTSLHAFLLQNYQATALNLAAAINTARSRELGYGAAVAGANGLMAMQFADGTDIKEVDTGFTVAPPWYADNCFSEGVIQPIPPKASGA